MVNSSKKLYQKLKIVFVISLTTFGFQIIGRLLSNSLALIADSFHVLIDFSAVAITLFAFRIAKKPHSHKMTFGFYRAEIMAAFISSCQNQRSLMVDSNKIIKKINSLMQEKFGITHCTIQTEGENDLIQPN
jgi:Co/Zn/Cd efflux system component